jgi:hypothetical protein
VNNPPRILSSPLDVKLRLWKPASVLSLHNTMHSIRAWRVSESFFTWDVYVASLFPNKWILWSLQGTHWTVQSAIGRWYA